MQLSTHFSLAEFTHSQTAARLGIDNKAPAQLMPALQRTAEGLERVRDLLGGKPIIVSSGYRSPSLNKAIGSKPTSQHTTGQAVDFTCPAFGAPREIVAALVGSGIQYDQCLLEFSAWVHLSFADKPRGQTLIIDKTGTKPWSK
jgi:hypothetical protein